MSQQLTFVARLFQRFRAEARHRDASGLINGKENPLGRAG